MDNKSVKKDWKIAFLPGDGTGPEIMKVTLPVIRKAAASAGVRVSISIGDAGYNCISRYGTNLPQKTIDLLKRSDCVMKGPMTTPEGAGSEISAAVKIRKMFSLYADVRPCKTRKGVPAVKENVDLVIVRENTEGMYSGIDFMVSQNTAAAMRVITRRGSLRIGEFALNLAEKRRKHLTIVHKGNILKVSDALFKDSIYGLGAGHKKVHMDDAHVDAMAQWLIKNPESYDVIVTENLFGDILSDEAAMIVGGIGVGPSANIGDGYAMFEPVHGSAPKYAGLDKVDPIATILSAKMMFEWMGCASAAEKIESAVTASLESGIKTYDIGGDSKCSEVGRYILKNI